MGNERGVEADGTGTRLCPVILEINRIIYSIRMGFVTSLRFLGRINMLVKQSVWSRIVKQTAFMSSGRGRPLKSK